MSRLLADRSLNARHLTALQAVRPDRIDGLAVWLDAADIDTTDGSLVQTWPDRSGNGNDFTQNTEANRPTWEDNEANGYPVLRFGTGKGMVSAVAFSSCSIFYVCANVNQGGGNRRAVQGVSNNWLLGPFQGNWRAYTGSFHETVIRPVSEPFIHGCVHEADTSLSQWCNRTRYDFTPNSTEIGTVALGVSGTANNPFLGDLAEVVMYGRALTVDEADAVVEWLADKYGIE